MKYIYIYLLIFYRYNIITFIIICNSIKYIKSYNVKKFLKFLTEKYY